MYADQTISLFDVSLRLGVEATPTRTAQGPGEIQLGLTVADVPDRASLKEQLEAQGFTMVTDFGAQLRPKTPGYGGFVLVAYRKSATVSLNFTGMPYAMLGAYYDDPEAHAPLEVSDGAFGWRDRRWPAWFSEARVSLIDPTACVVRARIEEGAIDRYRIWARERGFEVEDPSNAWEDEPDCFLEEGLRFRDRDALVELRVDDGALLLTLRDRRVLELLRSRA